MPAMKYACHRVTEKVRFADLSVFSVTKFEVRRE